MKNLVLIKKFLPYYKKYIPTIFLDLLCASLSTICDLVFPLIVKEITNRAIDPSIELTVTFISNLGILYLVLRIIDGIANYYMADIGHVMGAKIEADMRNDMFKHLQTLSFSYYSKTKIGTLMSRITNDLFDITEFSHHCPEEFFIASVKIIISFIILSNINITLTLIMFATLPLMFITTSYFRKQMRNAFKESRVQIGELNSQVEDSLQGVRVVKSFANEDIECKKFENGNSLFLKIKKKSYKYMACFQTITRLFDGLMYLLIVIVGSLYIINNKITPSDLTAYLLFASTLLASIRKIVEFSEQFQRGMTGIERFNEIMEETNDIIEIENPISLPEIEGNIKIDNVCFSYSDNNKEILSNIDIEIKPGDRVALVGPSGSGKTTLCNLIPRFYDVTKGNIYIDGYNIKDLSLKSLRNNIGIVQQDVYLFSGTIFENIAYGKPDATETEVINAAIKAGASDFIDNLPDKYQTYVGERGIKLSGGQKQRISIARVFLKDPKILILDEATSALDNESEAYVQQSIDKLSGGRTTFTIAHRLSTIKNSTHILVLTEKGIEESGNHNELMNKNGIYNKLYNSYIVN